ncbi:17706_t:CDS:1, partial [Gigaspora rosea]
QTYNKTPKKSLLVVKTRNIFQSISNPHYRHYPHTTINMAMTQSSQKFQLQRHLNLQ